MSRGQWDGARTRCDGLGDQITSIANVRRVHFGKCGPPQPRRDEGLARVLADLFAVPAPILRPLHCVSSRWRATMAVLAEHQPVQLATTQCSAGRSSGCCRSARPSGRSRWAHRPPAPAADLDAGHLQGGTASPPRGLGAHAGRLPVVGDETGVLAQAIASHSASTRSTTRRNGQASRARAPSMSLALVQEPRAQQQECDRETDEHEGDQEQPGDHLGRYLPGDPHTRLLLQPSPRVMARAGGGVGAHPVARVAPRKPSWAALLVMPDRRDHGGMMRRTGTLSAAPRPPALVDWRRSLRGRRAWSHAPAGWPVDRRSRVTHALQKLMDAREAFQASG